MNTNNGTPEPANNMERLKQQAEQSACGAGCSCHSPGASARTGRLICAVILIVAGVLVVRAVTKTKDAPAATAATAFALPAAPTATLDAAARTLQKYGIKVGLFTLRAGSPDYDLLGAQAPTPGVMAMVKGRGMSAISGEISETKLVQCYVAAASAGGCGAGGCGPTPCP